MKTNRTEALPLPDACMAAGVSYQRGWRAIANGRLLEAVRVGGRWWVRPDELARAAAAPE